MEKSQGKHRKEILRVEMNEVENTDEIELKQRLITQSLARLIWKKKRKH